MDLPATPGPLDAAFASAAVAARRWSQAQALPAGDSGASAACGLALAAQTEALTLFLAALRNAPPGDSRTLLEAEIAMMFETAAAIEAAAARAAQSDEARRVRVLAAVAAEPLPPAPAPTAHGAGHAAVDAAVAAGSAVLDAVSAAAIMA